MRKHNILTWTLTIIVLLGANFGFAERVDELFNEGNLAYENKEFDKAIQKYEDILNYDIQNPIVYFNLGNAHYKNGSLGKAIQYYEKAYQLAPRNKDIYENLTLARALAVDKVETPTPGILAVLITRFYEFFALNELALLTLFHFIGVMLIASLMVLVRNEGWRRFLWIFNSFGIILFILFALTFAVKHNELKQTTDAIVLEEKVDAYSEPDDRGSVSFTIHEGKKVRILQYIDKWAKIELENSWQGWVNQQSLGEI